MCKSHDIRRTDIEIRRTKKKIGKQENDTDGDGDGDDDDSSWVESIK